MAAQDFKKSVTVAGYYIDYLVSNGGFVSIEVSSTVDGRIAVIDTKTAFDTASSISDTITDLNREIRNNERDISDLAKDNLKQDAILNDPTALPTEKAAAQAKIAQNNTRIQELSSQNTSLQQVASYLSSNANSDFSPLVDQAKASVASTTAAPAETTATTTTTATNGPTTTTETTTTTTSADGTTTTTTITNSNTTSSKGTIAGTASDDSGASQGTTATSPAAPAGAGGTTPSTAKSTASSGSTKTGVAPSGTNTSANSGNGSASPTNATSGVYKFQSSIVSNQPVATASQPGKRLQNPLGEFSSYTYQITLYMVTPDAYEAFIASGRKKINILNEASGGQSKGGAFIIAQSGGINKSSSSRPPGFDFDYGIDNLSIKHMLTGKATGSATTISEMSFTISEPYGFSFLSNLRKAGDALAQYSKGIKSGPENPSRQFFILGIRFLGYDASGRVMLPNTKLSSGNGVLDPLSESGDLFEHFYDISIVSIKFKIDGRMVTYQCKAVSAGPGKGFSTTRGFLQSDQTVTADTVGVAIDKLITQINTEQKKLADGTPPSLKYPNQYEIIWLPGTEEILNASIISPARFEKLHWPGSGAKTTKDSNAGKEAQQQTANKNFKELKFTNSYPIIQAINDIIKQSSYLEDALAVVYTSDPQANPDTKAQYAQKPAVQKKKVAWYNCHPQITEIKWDDMVKDWSYKISYLIQRYETPVVDSPMVQSGKTYPGPHKRYSYWYTGENREIIQYEQVLDNSFYNTVVSAGQTTATAAKNSTEKSATDPNKTGGANSQTPVKPNMQSNQPRQGSTGYGLEAQNSYVTALYDPSSYATAKITILGDPDFLAEEPSYSEEQIYDQYYGSNGFSLNANGGQVFIEIDFKEAIDYTSGGGQNDDENKTYQRGGTLKINDSILFWKYPDSIAKKIKGVSYFVISCVSTFSNGMFKQVLDCTVNDFGDTTEKEASKAAIETATREGETLAQNQAKAAGDKTAETPDSDASSADAAGTKPDQPQQTNNTQGNAAPATNATATPTSNTGPGGTPVATDDGKKT